MARKAHRKRKRARLAPPLRRSAPGSPPGTLIADPAAPKGIVRAIAYDAESFEERSIQKLEEISELRSRFRLIWVDVDGLGDADLVRRIGEQFGLHPLALEDVLNVHQRAKCEDYGQHHFIVMRMASPHSERLETEQVAIFLGADFVITFQEDVEGDSFNPVRERLRKGVAHLRTLGADFLAYTLIDSVVDHYFPVLEHFGERLDVLEDRVISVPTRETLDMVHEVKRDLLSLRKAFWPLREAVNTLVRDPIPLIKPETRIYFRDIYDHIVQVIDIIETYREMSSSLMDVYLSSLSHRMNEVMKVLTVIATIFIPLTFISGLYGMNFDPKVSPYNMPELEWYWGYPFALSLMVMTVGILLLYFRRRGWLGGEDTALERRAALEKKTAAQPPP